jgi:curved DNA-binding protein CbpA
MSMVNLYEILEVMPNVSDHDIKKSYKQLVKKYHPDKCGSKDNFELITRAYLILSDPIKRAQYDDLYTLSNLIHTTHSTMKKQHQEYVSQLQLQTTEADAKQRFDTYMQVNNEIPVINTLSVSELMKQREEDEKNVTTEPLKQAIIPHVDMPNAWNDYEKAQYGLLSENNSTQDAIYTNYFSSLDVFSNTSIIPPEQEYNINIEDKIKDYNLETDKLHNLTLHDYKNEIQDPYNINQLINSKDFASLYH